MVAGRKMGLAGITGDSEVDAIIEMYTRVKAIAVVA
jgi:hypothetical protein